MNDNSILTILLSLSTILMLCWSLSSKDKLEALEKKVANNVVIELEDARFVCKMIETKKITWESVK